MTKRIVMGLVLVCAAFSFAPCKGVVDAEFRAALKRGADYRTVLKVVDDSGVSVEGASVRATIEQLHKIYTVRGTTDTNGLFTISGRTTGNEIVIDVTKDGYYGSRREHCLIAMGAEREVRDGRWQPYGAEEELLLRRIEDPVSLPHEWFWEFRYTMERGRWIGYDILKNDFVGPIGHGDISDFEVFVEWDGRWMPGEYKGMKVCIRFPEHFAGFYEYDARNESEFIFPYHAQTNMGYRQSCEFSERVNPDGSRVVVEFDRRKCWVVRSRCRVDERGRLVAANYSVLSDIAFCCKMDGRIGFCVTGAFNPTPNDTNLEAKR